MFSGGIGERSEALRSFIGSKVQCLGYAGVDISKNSAADTSHQEETVVDIGLDVGTNQREGHRLLVVRTDEQVTSFLSVGADTDDCTVGNGEAMRRFSFHRESLVYL